MDWLKRRSAKRRAAEEVEGYQSSSSEVQSRIDDLVFQNKELKAINTNLEPIVNELLRTNNGLYQANDELKRENAELKNSLEELRLHESARQDQPISSQGGPISTGSVRADRDINYSECKIFVVRRRLT